MSPRRPPAPRARTCIAPTGDVGDSLEATPLCGRPATTERLVEGVRCPLCALHAAEYDADLAADRETN